MHPARPSCWNIRACRYSWTQPSCAASAISVVSSLALIAGHAKVVRKGAEVTSTEDSVLVGNLVLQSCRAVIN